MRSFNVQAVATLRPMPEVCGYLAAPPVSFPTLASDWNLDPDTDIDGRYIEQNLGQAQGVMVPKLQDTFISGTSGRTGQAFTVISGTWKDDFVDPTHDVYGLLMPDTTPSIAWEVRSASITAGIEAADVVIRRGIPPANDSGARSRTGYTCYLELAYNASDNTGCRLAFEWGRPIRLDSTVDNGSTWQPAAIARSLGNLERYLAAHAGIIRLRIIPDADRGRLSVEIGDEAVLVYSRPTLDLPAPGNLRLYGLNGSIRFCYFPLRAQPVTITSSIDTAQYQQNAGAGFLTFNGPASVPNGQSVTYDLGTDGTTFTYQATGTTPDAGDGLGGTDAPVLASATLIVPAVWTNGVDQIPDPVGAIDLPVRSVEESQFFDDASRTLTSSAVVIGDNQYGEFTNAYGNRSITIYASNGGQYYPRFNGIAGASLEGIDLSTESSLSLGRITLPCRGSEVKMQHGAAQRRLYDGWCLYSAVRFECELGNVHPQFLTTIPLYVPPGTNSFAPYGPADANCAYPVLASGTGLSPRYDFGPELSPWSVLNLLARESGEPDPVTLASLPFYMGFDVTGQFRFEAFNPDGLLPVMYYSDIDSSGQGLILGDLHVYNSVAQMRSNVDFQGQDERTGELLMAHITLSDDVRKAIGFHYPWLESNSRFNTGNIQQAAETAAQIAGAAQQIVKFKAPFQPIVYAGQKIIVSERRSLGGAGQFIILEMMSRYGMRSLSGSDGLRDCYSVITARRV
jgi:hypothetical protein